MEINKVQTHLSIVKFSSFSAKKRKVCVKNIDYICSHNFHFTNTSKMSKGIIHFFYHFNVCGIDNFNCLILRSFLNKQKTGIGFCTLQKVRSVSLLIKKTISQRLDLIICSLRIAVQRFAGMLKYCSIKIFLQQSLPRAVYC